MRYFIILSLFFFSCEGRVSNQSENLQDSEQVIEDPKPYDTVRYEFSSFEEGSMFNIV